MLQFKLDEPTLMEDMRRLNSMKRSFNDFSSEDDEKSESQSSATSAASTVSQPPSSQRLMTNVGRILNREMGDLSLEERNLVFEDVHAVTKDVTEDTEFANECLAKLPDQLRRRRKQKKAYEKAAFLGPLFVNNRNFLLSFLRCDRYDIVKASERILAHFDLKLDLFGPDKLAKHITFEDLTSEEQEQVRNGICITHSNLRDIGGRFINIAMIDDSFRLNNEMSFIRVMWYLTVSMHAFDSAQDQLRGYVQVLFGISNRAGHGGPASSSEALMGVIGILIRAAPKKICGLHLSISDNPDNRSLSSQFQLNLNPECRLRFRAHYGDFASCMYAIHGYGMQLPINDRNDRDLTEYTAHLDEQIKHEVEESMKISKNPDIVHPKKFDVLLGRGRPYQHYTGNSRLQVLIRMNRERYLNATQYGAKVKIGDEVVHIIAESGGRFLKRNAEKRCWEEVDFQTARDKVAHAFRSNLGPLPPAPIDESQEGDLKPKAT